MDESGENLAGRKSANVNLSVNECRLYDMSTVPTAHALLFSIAIDKFGDYRGIDAF